MAKYIYAFSGFIVSFAVILIIFSKPPTRIAVSGRIVREDGIPGSIAMVIVSDNEIDTGRYYANGECTTKVLYGNKSATYSEKDQLILLHDVSPWKSRCYLYVFAYECAQHMETILLSNDKPAFFHEITLDITLKPEQSSH